MASAARALDDALEATALFDRCFGWIVNAGKSPRADSIASSVLRGRRSPLERALWSHLEISNSQKFRL